MAVVMSLMEYRRPRKEADRATSPMERFLSRAEEWRARTGGHEIELPDRRMTERLSSFARS